MAVKDRQRPHPPGLFRVSLAALACRSLGPPDEEADSGNLTVFVNHQHDARPGTIRFAPSLPRIRQEAPSGLQASPNASGRAAPGRVAGPAKRRSGSRHRRPAPAARLRAAHRRHASQRLVPRTLAGGLLSAALRARTPPRASGACPLRARRQTCDNGT